jgi:hypothetical protein
VLHQQLIAGVQGAEAGNHENSCHRCPLGVGYDSGIIAAITLKLSPVS